MCNCAPSSLSHVTSPQPPPSEEENLLPPQGPAHRRHRPLGQEQNVEESDEASFIDHASVELAL